MNAQKLNNHFAFLFLLTLTLVLVGCSHDKTVSKVEVQEVVSVEKEKIEPLEEEGEIKTSKEEVEEVSEILYNPDGTINTSNWKIYTNDEHGFSVAYPDGWKFEEDRGCLGCEFDVYISPLEIENDISFSFFKDDKDFQEWALKSTGVEESLEEYYIRNGFIKTSFASRLAWAEKESGDVFKILIRKNTCTDSIDYAQLNFIDNASSISFTCSRETSPIDQNILAEIVKSFILLS